MPGTVDGPRRTNQAHNLHTRHEAEMEQHYLQEAHDPPTRQHQMNRKPMHPSFQADTYQRPKHADEGALPPPSEPTEPHANPDGMDSYPGARETYKHDALPQHQEGGGQTPVDPRMQHPAINRGIAGHSRQLSGTGPSQRPVMPQTLLSDSRRERDDLMEMEFPGHPSGQKHSNRMANPDDLTLYGPPAHISSSGLRHAAERLHGHAEESDEHLNGSFGPAAGGSARKHPHYHDESTSRRHDRPGEQPRYYAPEPHATSSTQHRGRAQQNSPQFSPRSLRTPTDSGFQSQSFQPEPICVLKIELEGDSVEEIRVFEGDIPAEIVEKFGEQFNLSDNAKRKLLEQIESQI